MAEAHLLQHLEVEHRALLEALRLEQLVLALEHGQPFAQLPANAADCGDVVASIHLDEPLTFDLSESGHYLCDGADPCWNVPVLSRGGIVLLAAALALAALLVLARRP